MTLIHNIPTTYKIRKSTFHIESNTRGFESMLTRQATDERLPGERWTAQIEFAPMTTLQYQGLRAILHRCDGRVGRLLFGPAGETTQGSAAGAATGASYAFSDATYFSDNTRFVDGSNYGLVSIVGLAGDDSIAVSGLVPSVTVLELGDLFQIGTPFPGPMQLLEAVLPARSNSSGVARITIRPRLRADVPVGTLVTFGSPKGLFRLADARQSAVQRGLFQGQHAFTLEEAI